MAARPRHAGSQRIADISRVTSDLSSCLTASVISATEASTSCCNSTQMQYIAWQHCRAALVASCCRVAGAGRTTSPASYWWSLRAASSKGAFGCRHFLHTRPITPLVSIIASFSDDFCDDCECQPLRPDSPHPDPVGAKAHIRVWITCSRLAAFLPIYSSLYLRSEAVLRIASRLSIPLQLLGGLAKPLPLSVRDAAYDQIANNRYNLFGKSDSCR